MEKPLPPPSKITSLPPEVSAQLDERLRNSQFTGYVEHAEWLRGLGYEVGKSGIHAYAQKHRMRIKLRAESGSAADATSSIKAADQRIECLKVAAILVPPDQILERADQLFQWAYRR